MKERLAKLINVKSIITILLAIVFSYLSISGDIQPDQFISIFTVVISFYFGVVSEKKDDSNNKDNSKDNSN